MFLKTIQSTIEKYQMIRPGNRILVAASGGPDSTALLGSLVALRNEWRLSLHAAYVDHGARPAAAEKEAAFVKKLGKLWAVPVTVLREVVRRQGGESWEAIARQVRYRALASLARQLKCQAIALGHTRDDQAETVLLWILRGTGVQGLAGIPPQREISLREESPKAEFSRPRRKGLRIIRPLIESSRSDVETFLRSHAVKAMKDATNDSLRFLRNRIRHELIPLLERQYNPQIRKHVSHLAQLFREDRNWIDRELEKRFQETVRVSRGKISFNRRRLKTLPSTLRTGVLKMGVERLQGDRLGFDSFHWRALDQLLVDGKGDTLDFPYRLRAKLQDTWLFLLRR